jgi:hypothetical protein
MRMKMVYMKTYKYPATFKCRRYAIIFVNTDSHLTIVFDISNLIQRPSHHSEYLEFNVALLFRHSKSQFKRLLINYTKCSVM